jgi:serine/threonine protein kinase
VRDVLSGSGAREIAGGTVVGGDYRIMRPLASGSMGAVYVAEQISTGAQRALKILRAEYVANDELFKRFEREAHLAGRIPSEHVAQIIGAGVDKELRAPWIAMELLEGITLDEHVAEQGQLPKDAVREIAEQICHALGAAHTLGIVHRDLKPGNIFLSQPRRVGSARVVKVLDFGLARLVAENLTVTGLVIGTPNWMSPEQTFGKAATPATDVWAIGLIVFYMLAGRPFWRACLEPNDRRVVMQEIANEPIPIASARALELGAGDCLPRGFDTWFAHCVARSPDDRFMSAAAAFTALASTLR